MTLGLFFDTKEIPDSAIFHLKIAQQIAEQCKSEIQITSAQTQAGFTMVQNGQPEAGLKQLEYERAQNRGRTTSGF